MDKIENEIKLGKSNLQVKYQTMDSNESIKKKIIFLCDILEIKMTKQRVVEILDNYYDTPNFDLLNRNVTFRKREADGKKEFTVKHTIEIKENKNEFSRNEFTKEIDSENENLIFNSILIEGLPEFDENIKKKIKSNVLINNERLKFHLKADEIECVLCFDKYFFYSDSDYSEYYYQVELEFKDSNADTKNDKFSKLINCVKVLFNFKPEASSKYKQAIIWLKDKMPKTHNVSVIMLDIVGYSLCNNLTQKNLIQHLNKVVKEVLNESYNILSKEEEIVYIPTGDGMIIVLFDVPEKLPTVCANIQRRIREFNLKVLEEELKYNIRIGVNYGPVFIYSDIKGNLNFAGNGINLVQRITNFGDSGHILFSKETYDLLTDKNNFKSEGKRKIKHGLEIEVYSYHSQEYKFGNPNHI